MFQFLHFSEDYSTLRSSIQFFSEPNFWLWLPFVCCLNSVPAITRLNAVFLNVPSVGRFFYMNNCFKQETKLFNNSKINQIELESRQEDSVLITLFSYLPCTNLFWSDFSVGCNFSSSVRSFVIASSSFKSWKFSQGLAKYRSSWERSWEFSSIFQIFQHFKFDELSSNILNLMNFEKVLPTVDQASLVEALSRLFPSC